MFSAASAKDVTIVARISLILVHRLYYLHVVRAYIVVNWTMTRLTTSNKPGLSIFERGAANNARSFARAVLRGNSRVHAGAGGGGFAQACDRPAGRCGIGL